MQKKLFRFRAKFFLPLLPLTIFNKFSHKTLAGVFNALHVKKSLWLTRFVIFVASLASYLFLHPGIGAQTTVSDILVPAKPAQSFVVVKETIAAIEIPAFNAPVHNSYISTYFSHFHQGIDLPAPQGTAVQAANAGMVTFAGWSTLGYGNLVTIVHPSGYEVLYAHLSAVNVKLGQQVNVGDVIGRVGRTGVATGPHLHLEIHLDSVPVNPLKYISVSALTN